MQAEQSDMVKGEALNEDLEKRDNILVKVMDLLIYSENYKVSDICRLDKVIY